MSFNLTAGIQDGFNFRRESGPGGAGGQEIEEGLVPDTAVFDDLPHAVGEGGVGEGGEGVGIHEHQPGLPEGSRQVFPRPEVHRHLAAHGGVHLGQEGGGELDEIHPPEDGGGGKARQVPHHAAAQGHHPVGAGKAEVQHGLPQLGEALGGFGGLTGGNLLAGGLKAAALQDGNQPGEVEGGHVGVRHHEEAGGLRADGPNGLAGGGKEAGGDLDVVGALL